MSKVIDKGKKLSGKGNNFHYVGGVYKLAFRNDVVLKAHIIDGDYYWETLEGDLNE